MGESKKKNKILDQSKELFENYGYQKTTLTDIAKSIGYVKSAIYYYFSGKEEIFASLVQKEANDFLEKLMEEVNTSADPVIQLRLYVNTRIDLMEALAKRYNFLKKEFFELMPLVNHNRKEADVKEIEFLNEILVKVSENYGIQIKDPSYSAKLLMQNIKGLEVQMFVTDEVQAHKEDREAFINFILYGLFNKQAK